MPNLTRIILGSGLVIVALLFLLLVLRIQRRLRAPKLDTAKFTRRWQDVQKLCNAKTTWPLAVINADKLLDEALKKSRMKGKTMGERLVVAQRRLSDNDGVWFGHKLRNRVVHEEVDKLKQDDIQAALRGFRQALKDLGALRHD
ncbi:MAG TPA: hypothetical protein VFT53_06580 [Candidatus Saccharimonadales bacterium]|nr:hypothetical protein [Candidatus Saccharimonadales bacterium]